MATFTGKYNGKYSVAILLLLLLVITSCANNRHEDWELDTRNLTPVEKVLYFREKLAGGQNDPERLILLREAEFKAESYYLGYGNHLLNQGDLDGALNSFNNGLLANPKNKEIIDSIQHIANRKKSDEMVHKARALFVDKQYTQAIAEIDHALDIQENNPQALLLHQQISLILDKNSSNKDALLDLIFDKADIKHAMEFVCQTYDISVVFDDSVKAMPISLSVKQISFDEAITLLLHMSKNQYHIIDNKTLLIYADTKERGRHYTQMLIRTFPLQAMAAKDMGALVKSVLDLRNITLNEKNNSIIIRGDAHAIALAQALIKENDQPKGEVTFDVEILEINLASAERLGIDYGSYALRSETKALSGAGSLSDNLKENTIITIPSITMSAFKQNVDAKTLANPRVRVLDGEKAKIHIGDRVPLRSSSIQDATGQTRTTFEYQEIGIRFNVQTHIRSDDYMEIELELEVSSLGENLGTTEEPAYRIGTRNATTKMLVRNHETAILGGLIREEERGISNQFKGLGALPILGSLFRSNDKSNGRTDVLLTITPRIIRGVRSSKIAHTSIQAGTADQLISGSIVGLKSLSLFYMPEQAKIEKRVNDEKITLTVNESNIGESGVNTQPGSTDKISAIDDNSMPVEIDVEDSQFAVKPFIRFDKQQYDVKQSDAVNAAIVIDNLVMKDDQTLVFQLYYNLDVIEFEELPDNDRDHIDGLLLSNVAGNIRELRVDADFYKKNEGKIPLQIKAIRQGTSFLIIKGARIEGADIAGNFAVKNAKVLVSRNANQVSD